MDPASSASDRAAPSTKAKLSTHFQTLFAAQPEGNLEVLQQALDAGHHVLCLLSGDAAARATLMDASYHQVKRDLIMPVWQPTPGELLFDLMRALQIHLPNEDAPSARRRLCLTLARCGAVRQSVLVLVDKAELLTPADINLLIHLFNGSFAQIILFGSSPLLERLRDAEVSRLPDWLGVLKPATAVPSAAAVHKAAEATPSPVAMPDIDTTTADTGIAVDAVSPTEIEAPLHANDTVHPDVAPPSRHARRSAAIWRDAALMGGVIVLAVLLQSPLTDLLERGGSLSGTLDRLRAAWTDNPQSPSTVADAPQAKSGAAPSAGRRGAASGSDAADFAALAPAPATPRNRAPADTGLTTRPAPQTVQPSSPPSTASDAATATPELILTPAQRAEVARLYAGRAEYEIERRDFNSAMQSVQLGLEADPDNPRLQQLRLHLQLMLGMQPPEAESLDPSLRAKDAGALQLF